MLRETSRETCVRVQGTGVFRRIRNTGTGVRGTGTGNLRRDRVTGTGVRNTRTEARAPGTRDIPIAFERGRQQLAEPPRAAGQEVLGGVPLGHDAQMRHAVRPVAERHIVPVQGNALDAQPPRPLQNRRVRGVAVGGADRLGRSPGLDAVPLLAPVRRALRDAYALAEPVRRFMQPHIDHVDLEIRIERVVVHHRQRDIGAVLPRAFEPGEADIIFDIRLARDERAELALRGVGGQHEHLGGGFGTGADDDVALVEAQAHTEPEPLVVLPEHLHVVGYRRADLVPAHRTGPPGVVEYGVEHPLGVRCDARSGDAFKHLGQFRSGAQVPNAEIVAFIAAGVDAVEHPAAITAQVHAADLEEVMSLGFPVRVEHHLFAGHGSGLAQRVDVGRGPVALPSDRQTALHRILRPFACAREIPVAVHARGHGHVGLLDA